MKKAVFAVVVVCFMVVFSMAAYAAPMSWGFEDGSAGSWGLQSGGQEWGIGEGTVEADNTRAYEGSYSLKVTGNVAAETKFSLNNDSEAKEAESTYIYSARVYVDADSNIASMQVFDQDANWGWSNEGSVQVTVDESMYGTWVEIMKPITSTAAFPLNRIGIEFISVDASKPLVVWVDAITVGPEGAAAPAAADTAAPAADAPATTAAASKTGDAGIMAFALTALASGLMSAKMLIKRK